jgi:hypothetical protein
MSFVRMIKHVAYLAIWLKLSFQMQFVVPTLNPPTRRRMSSLVPLLSTVENAEALVLQYLTEHLVGTLTVVLPDHDTFDRRIVQGDSHAIARRVVSACGRKGDSGEKDNTQHPEGMYVGYYSRGGIIYPSWGNGSSTK